MSAKLQTMSKTQTSQNNVILPSEFDTSRVTATVPKKNKDGKINSYFTYGGERCFFQTPELKAPFGVTAFEPKNNTKGPTELQWSLNLSALPSDDTKHSQQYIKNVNEWFEKLSEIDEKMIEHAYKHSEIVFGKPNEEQFEEQSKNAPKGSKGKSAKDKPITRDLVSALYSKVVKEDEKYPSRIQPKINKKIIETKESNSEGNEQSGEKKIIPDLLLFKKPTKGEKMNSTPINFDSLKNKLNESFTFEDLVKLVPKGSYVTAIVEPRIWYIAGKAGLSLNVVQLVYTEQSGGKPKNYAFRSEDNDSDQKENENEKDNKDNYQQDSDTEAQEVQVNDDEEVEEV